MTIKIKFIMNHIDLGLFYFHKKNLGQCLEFVTSVFCSGSELHLVEDWRRVATTMGEVWLHLQY